MAVLWKPCLPEHLSYCSVTQDIYKFEFHVVVRHETLKRTLTFHESARSPDVMKAVFETKRELKAIHDVTEALTRNL